MTAGHNKPSIEGLTSPAASAVNAQRENAPAGFNLELVRSLRMHTKLAAYVTAGIFVMLIVFALSRKPMYSAQSLTYVEPMTSKVLSDGTGGGFDPSRYDSYLQQQMQTALRPDILASAIRKLPPGIWQHSGEKEQAAVARLQKSLKVERVTTSYQLSIALSGPDPDAVAATVNAVTNAYLEQGRKDEHAISSQRLQLLTQERQRIQSDLEQDRTEQAGLSGALGVASPVGELANPYDTQLSGVRTQLAAARAAHDVALAQLASVRRSAGAQTPGLAAAADDLLQTDTGLGSMKATINQRKAVLSSQMAGLTPSNPVYKQDQDEIADLDRSLDTMTAQLRDKAEHRVEDKLGLELQRTASIESMLNAQLSQQTATATSAAPKIQRAAELASDITRLTARFGTVDDAIRGLELEANGPGMAHLSVSAAVPLTPDPSKRKLLLLLSLPLALLMGAGAAVLAHRRDPLVYTEKDLQQVLGFPPIGVLPSRDDVSRATIEEYVFRVAAGVETAYRVSSARSFVFTAASPNVVLTGLIAILREKLEGLGFTVHVLQANVLLQPGLGGGSPAPARHRELPGSGYLALLHDPNHEGFAAANLAELKKNHDLLLIDAPPLLHSAATEYAVRCADATILVAGSAITQRVELTQAAVLLDRLNVAGVGAVLKDLMLKHADPSFKTAIEVLESRWSAEALEASRASRASRAAHHTSRTPKTSYEKADVQVTSDAHDRRFSETILEAVHSAPADSAAQTAHATTEDEPAKRPEESNGPVAESATEEEAAHHAAFDPHVSHTDVDREVSETEHDVNTHHEELQEKGFTEPVTLEEPRERIASSTVPAPSLHEHDLEIEETVKPAEMPAPQFTPSLRNDKLTTDDREIETSERAKVWLHRLLNPGSALEPVNSHKAVANEVDTSVHDQDRFLAQEHVVSPSSFVEHEEESPAKEAVMSHAEKPGIEPVREALLESMPPEPDQAVWHDEPVTTHETHKAAVADLFEEDPAVLEEEPMPEQAHEFVEPALADTLHTQRETFGTRAEYEGIHESISTVVEAQGEVILDTASEAEPHEAVKVEPSLEDRYHLLYGAETEQDMPKPAEQSEPAVELKGEIPFKYEQHATSHDVQPSEPTHETSLTVEDLEPVSPMDALVPSPKAIAEGRQFDDSKDAEPAAAPVTPAPWETGRTARLEQAARLAGPPQAEQTNPETPVPFRATFSGVRRAAALREGRDSAISKASRLHGRIEGSVEPETGQMTRSWGMLSRFGSPVQSDEALVPPADDRSGQ